MLHAVCTLNIGDEAARFAQYSIPVFQQYAKKIGAEFIEFNTPKVNFTRAKTINPIKFEKYQVADLLNTYDRVAFFDVDVLITPRAPNIFRAVPYDKIGGVFEDVANLKEDRRELIMKAQDILGDVGWQEGYMNSGVFVVSKPHQKAFKLIWECGVYDDFYEQTNTNWCFRKSGIAIKNISRKWNFMGWMRVAYGPVHRQAYAIHYAGGGIFGGIPRWEQMKEDYEYFYG
jgi:lipopolysaccharide biosynthesis glycosyltransferase